MVLALNDDLGKRLGLEEPAAPPLARAEGQIAASWIRS
jgi:hypothetical protein